MQWIATEEVGAGMSEISDGALAEDDDKLYYVYLISCRGPSSTYVKIGLSCNLKRRISEIQTGCPFQIGHAFAVPSEYWEEAAGLEKLLHMMLRPQRLRAEWYEGTRAFFAMLELVLCRINDGAFSYDECQAMPDFVGPEFEIMLHRHDFCFYEVSLPIARGADPLSSAVTTSPARIAKLLSKR